LCHEDNEERRYNREELDTIFEKRNSDYAQHQRCTSLHFEPDWRNADTS
jgi:hypothetical protein